MFPLLRSALVVTGFALTACRSPEASRNDAPATTIAPTSVGERTPSYDRLFGAVSEDEFAALHHPPSNVAPPRRGELIDLAGTRAYLSLPQGADAPVPGVVVIHEWWGLNEHIMHWTDRLAAEGYAAIAVDLYGGVVATEAQQAKEAMKAVDDRKALATMTAALRFLRSDPRIQAPRTASIGWCFGGSQSLLLALSAPDLDACVVYYGSPVLDPAALAPMHASLLGIFGTRDKSIPPERVHEFEKALGSAGKTYSIKSYDAEHAFANPSNSRYEEGSAAAAWNEVRAFLKAQLLPGR